MLFVAHILSLGERHDTICRLSGKFFLRAGVTVLFIRLYCVELCLPILYVIHESLHSQSVKIRNIYLSMLKFTTSMSCWAVGGQRLTVTSL